MRERKSASDQFALWITTKVRSINFFYIIFGWTIGWLGWNIVMPPEYRFDPAPAFVLWLFISNMIQIFLMPLILIGQNIHTDGSEKRADKTIKDLTAEIKENRKEILEIKKLLNRHFI